MPTLFDPLTLGALALPNRVLMAPLTRGRATRDHVPTPAMADYYAQRASAGLIISEATGISRAGLGWPYAPGLWTDAQVEGWRPVTAAVHERGGRIVAQLWHMGRIVHSSLSGTQPISASATAAPGKAHTYEGRQPYEEARPATAEDLAQTVEDYARAAANAMRAGFDGVQIHAANGYLIDQFLRDGGNRRDDDYGGPPANRSRLLQEVVRAVAGVVGADRTGVRLSPNGDSQGIDDSDPHTLFAHVAGVLHTEGVAWLELREPGPEGTFGRADGPAVHPVIRRAFSGPLVLNSDYTGARAEAALREGEADAVSFGRPFIANPDLPRRLREGLPLAADAMATWYSQGPEGYTDYPAAA